MPLTSIASAVALRRRPLATADAGVQRSRWTGFAWLVIVTIGAFQAWVGREAMNPDGIAYLDLARAVAQGDWTAAFNRLWSPLYPVLLGVVLRVLRPALLHEFAVVHAVNFAIFLAAFASFEFLLRQLLWDRQAAEARAAVAGRVTLPAWWLRILGYVLFAYASFGPIALAAVSPDMAVAACVYLATGLLLKIRRAPDGPVASFSLLGGVLGLGYLAKAPMFPLALVFLALAVTTVRPRLSIRRVVRCLLVALLPFAIIAGSLVLAFSFTGQSLTLGESGRLNYAWMVNGLPYVHWQGENHGSGRPVHPTRQIMASPPVYEFAAPVTGTYPPWNDPAYWYEGVTMRFDVRGHLHNVARSARVLAGMILRSQLGLVIGSLLLLRLGTRGRFSARDLFTYSALLIPGLVALAMFSPIWLELRFIAPFVPLLWLGVFAPMTFVASRSIERRIHWIIAAMLVVTLPTAATASYAITGGFLARQRTDEHLAVAQALQQFGVVAGTPVAVIWGTRGSAYAYWDPYWALLSRVRIVAEIPQCRVKAGPVCDAGQPDGATAFLQADRNTQSQILSILAQTGAAAVVLRDGDRPLPPGWRRIPSTDYAVYLVRDETAADPRTMRR